MKDRPPSSYGAVYVPPHHRLRSVITSPNYTSSGALVDTKLRENESAVLNPRSSSCNLPYFKNQQEEQFRKPNFQYNSAYDDGVSEEGSDREFDSSSHPVSFTYFLSSFHFSSYWSL